MFEGNRFFPETGIPIWNRDRSRTRFAVWLPEPLTVATWMLKSLTMFERDWSGSICVAGNGALMLQKDDCRDAYRFVRVYRTPSRRPGMAARSSRNTVQFRT